MLLSNLQRIIEDNFGSLSEEAWGSGYVSKSFVFLVFVLNPVILGLVLGWAAPLWMEISGALFSVIGILTGFSINALVLLTGHSEEESYQLKTDVVKQTKDFTLYSILIGVVLLVFLTMSFLISKYSGFSKELPRMGKVNSTQFISMAIYTVLLHYFLILFVITHRLYSLVHGKALGS